MAFEIEKYLWRLSDLSDLFQFQKIVILFFSVGLNRTTSGAALLGAIGATLALKQQGSNSSPANIETSATMQSPFDPEASFSEEAEALIEAEEGRHDPMLGMDADDNDEYHDEEQNVISEYEGAPALEASSSARLRHPAGGGVTK